jgi:hypothetical protein
MVAEEPAYDIEPHVRARVANVSRVVHSWAALIPRHDALGVCEQRLLCPSQRVRHRHSSL